MFGVVFLFGAKVMTQMKNKQKCKKNATIAKNTQIRVFFCKNTKKVEIFAFCVPTFEPITYRASQNECLNLSFVKDIHAIGKKKWLEMVVIWPSVSRRLW